LMCAAWGADRKDAALHNSVVNSIQTGLKLLLPSSNNGMSSLSFSSGQAETGFG